MNCEFCNKSLKFSHYENVKEIAVYDCVYCPVLTSFYFNSKVPLKFAERIKTSFMFEKQNKTYIWTNNYMKNISHITDLSPDAESIALSRKDPVIISFQKIMDINPNNIYEKFSFVMTYL